ncbi:unnamed protein product [Schistosoma mattheei]|uniref:Uncharacterized protein n=1 Tax=Schistosoma mattheei TaxID=31246 RepID=A0AA85B1Y8_9TREM|nr:unnamed protein product [Schistosoma mattheei]
MFLPRSEGLTLNEFLSLHPSDISTIPLQSTIYNHNHNNTSIEQKFNNQHSRNFSTFMNHSTIKQPMNKEEIINPSILTRTKSNFSNKQPLKRSNTISVTKNINEKLNSNISIDELIQSTRQQKKHLPVQYNPLNDTVMDNNGLIQKLHQQRLFQRAQSEHPIRDNSDNNNNNNVPNSHSVSLPPHTWNNNNNTSSTFRSIFSQRGYNFGRSFWQQNFTSDQNELKSSLGSAHISSNNREMYGLLLCTSLTLNHFALSLITSTTTVTSSTSATISSTGTPTHFNKPSSDQYTSKMIWSEKFVEEFLKKSLLTTSTNNVVHNQNEPVCLSNSFSGTTLVQWFCRHIIKSGCPWSHGLISVVCQLCNCLLQLGVLRRDLKSKTVNSTSTDNKSFRIQNISSYRNSSNATAEIFELNMDYVWSGNNVQENTTVINSSMNANDNQQQSLQEQQQQIDEYKQFQMTIYNHIINLHKEFQYELDRVTREHELQLFKVKNQGVMKVCQLTDRIEALENQVEKYRILAGIEQLNKSTTINSNHSLHNCYSSLVTNKNRLSKVTFNLSNENVLNQLSRRTRAFSETIDMNHFNDNNTYNKPDYIKSSIRHILNDIEQLLSPTSQQHHHQLDQQQEQQQHHRHQLDQQQEQQQHHLHQLDQQQEQQQEQQRLQHSRSNSMNLYKSHELSLLKNSKQKCDSFNNQEKENSFNNRNCTDLNFHSFDNDTINNGNDRIIEDNANKMNNLSKFNDYNIHQHENSMNTTLTNNKNDNQIHQKINLRNSTSRFLSVPPHSKFILDQTTSMLYNQPVLGILAKYGANNKHNTLQTSMKKDHC